MKIYILILMLFISASALAKEPNNSEIGTTKVIDSKISGDVINNTTINNNNYYSVDPRDMKASNLGQKTEGWCSPAVADIKGNVKITCNGVDPRAMKNLNDLLEIRNLQLSDKIKEADEWTKRYRDLEESIKKMGDDDADSKEALRLIKEGELLKAGAILDNMILRQEKQVDKIAENHYNRGQLFLMQFKPLDALPHLEKAYNYRQDNYKYAHEYAWLLQKQNNFKEALPVYEKNLNNLRKLAESNPSAYLPVVATTLNNIALFHLSNNEPLKGQSNIEEALKIMRELYKNNPNAYGNNLAQSLGLYALILIKTEPKNKNICNLLVEAQRAAYADNIKQTTKSVFQENCAK
jgi:tetratricopeptide (TPR) repeat protein